MTTAVFLPLGLCKLSNIEFKTKECAINSNIRRRYCNLSPEKSDYVHSGKTGFAKPININTKNNTVCIYLKSKEKAGVDRIF